MTTPEAHAGLAAALAAVQAELPGVQKNRSADVVNKDGRKLYSYSYADLADVSAAIMPVLGKHGLAFTAFPTHQADGKFGLRYYLLHRDGGSIEGFYEIPDQGGMQMVGGRITYARRYCLCAVTGIAADEDVDARDDGQARKPQQRRQQAAGDSDGQRTAQRRTPAASSQQERDETLPPLPPLPDEPGPTTSPRASSPAGQGRSQQRTQPPSASTPDGSAPAPGPDEPGSITQPQLAKIAVTFAEAGYARTEREEIRGACATIIGRPLKTSTNMSLHEASTVIDILAGVTKIAQLRGGTPREVLTHLLSDVRAVALAEFDRIGITGDGVSTYAGQLLSVSPPASLDSLAAMEAVRLAVLLARCADRAALDALLAEGTAPGE